MTPTLQELIESKRAKMPEQTNAFRVSDGYPWSDVFIDMLDNRLLISLRNCPLPKKLRRQLEATGLSVFVKQLDKDNKQVPEQIAGPILPLRFEIEENGVVYMMDMEAGYSQGIFLDQRDNRYELRQRCKHGNTILNTFSYTGAFSVCGAIAGAQTTTLDLARPCLDWCKVNMKLNGIDPESHHFCKGDTLHWLERFKRQGRRFDGIVLDPPTFSRDEKGRIWRVETDYEKLVALAFDCLTDHGWILCSTNCRKFSLEDFHAMVLAGAPNCKLTTSPMPVDFDGEPYLKCIWVDRRG